MSQDVFIDLSSALDMPTSEFVREGRKVIDWIAQYLDNPRRYPVLSPSRGRELRNQLPSRAPLTGESMEVILEDFERLIVPHVTHWNHPGFHGYFSITSSAPGILGELLTATLNVNAMLWRSCPAATELEEATVSWLLDWLGLPNTWFGMILDSAANGALHAVTAARLRADAEGRNSGCSPRLVVYISEQTHSSIEKAAIAAGIGQSRIRRIPVDSNFRMNTDALESAIEADKRNDLMPFFVAATVGTTSSTAIDPIERIAAICGSQKLWLHVDAALGGAFAIVPECRHILNGVEHADSFVMNPHKMLMVPLDCSLFYTRHPRDLRNAFSLEAEYLKTDTTDVTNYMDYGLALGRRFRALKLWFVMRYFGRDGLVSILRRSLAMAAWLVEQIKADERFELVGSMTMGLVCFRLREGNEATKELMARINNSGRFFVSHTVLEDRFVIRIAIGNIRTEIRDIKDLWSAISARI